MEGQSVLYANKDAKAVDAMLSGLTDLEATATDNTAMQQARNQLSLGVHIANPAKCCSQEIHVVKAFKKVPRRLKAISPHRSCTTPHIR